MLTITPEHWHDYELIDTGGLEKLERFGKYILARPEPQAVWQKALSDAEWEKLCHAHYIRTRGVDLTHPDSGEKGDWNRKKNMPDQWFIQYTSNQLNLKFRLGLTAFGHIGIFPEQAANWEYIYNTLLPSPLPRVGEGPEVGAVNREEKEKGARVLNLFAYTGGSSLAARAAGADVLHVDSVKPVINWAREDMELSGLKDIRWVVEDALTFVRREVKRGNKYSGIILDPPAYGRGPQGEKWVLQEYINEMIFLCSKLLEEKNSFLILSLYSIGFSALIGESLVKTHFGLINDIESGELFFPDRAGRSLPLGTFLRFKR